MNCEGMVQIPHEKNQKYVEFFTARLADSIKVFEDEIAKYIYAKCDATLEVPPFLKKMILENNFVVCEWYSKEI